MMITSLRNIRFILQCHISKWDMYHRAKISLLDKHLKMQGCVNLFLEEVKDLERHPPDSVINLNLQIRL